VISVVIPAHNEAPVIGRLLGRLVGEGAAGAAARRDLDVIVVSNGSTDSTAQIAASFGPAVRVLSIPVASKREALRAGDQAAAGFPRIYVDADVELGAPDVRALAAALRQPGVLAAAPRRALRTEHSPWPVRWYYDIWSRLPEVQCGLFGRGVIAVSEPGHQRLAVLPALLSDDLAASLSFTPAERQVVAGACAIVRVPRTLADLVRRRVRVVTGVAQLERAGPVADAAARTTVPHLAAMLRGQPSLAPRLAVFLAVTVIARLAARRALARRDYTTWLRDESSRRPAGPG
jgi:Glycosyl transferase family 2